MNHPKKNFRIFLCGDVMIGRGIDQILPHPSKSQLYESYVTDAREYVFLAEKTNGKIFYPVAMDYIWGDALSVWQELQPDIKIVNLETAITESDNYWLDKDIHYRMHPLNISVLSAAGIDICTLANNHILDWSQAGLQETITILKKSGIQFSGAGECLTQAMQPAIFELTLNKKVLVFSAGASSSGVPSNWEATTQSSGVYYLNDLSDASLVSIAKNIKQYKQP